MQDVLQKLKNAMREQQVKSVQLSAAAEAYAHAASHVKDLVNDIAAQANQVPTKDEQMALIATRLNEIPGQLHRFHLKATQDAITTSGIEAGISSSINIIEKHAHDEGARQQQHESLLAHVETHGTSQRRKPGERPERLRNLRNAAEELKKRKEVDGDNANQDS